MATAFTPRSQLQLLEDQLHGMAIWQRVAKAREQSASSNGTTREARLDRRRWLEALQRANATLQTRLEAESTWSPPAPRAVVVHRLDWMREKIALGLEQNGIRVIAEASDGADALGIAVAEQPDVLVLQEPLPSMPTTEVLRSLRDCAPHTLVAAQVDSDRSVGDMLDAGARAVFSRRVPPATIAEQLASYLGVDREDVLLLT